VIFVNKFIFLQKLGKSIDIKEVTRNFELKIVNILVTILKVKRQNKKNN